MHKLIEISKNMNSGRIEFLVLADNKDAIAFYNKVTTNQIISDKLHYMRIEIESEPTLR